MTTDSTTGGLALEIEMLTPAQAAEIWKRQTKRAPNFPQYQMFMDTHDVGATWKTKVPAGDRNADDAKEIRHNFNDAARERTVWIEYSGLAPANATETSERDGKKYARVPAPVLIRWKVNSHKDQREVVDPGSKKKATIEVTVVDSLTALIVATDAVQHRNPRKTTEDVSALAATQNAPADAKKGAKFTLADGREALRTQAGKWRALPLPKATETPTTNGTDSGRPNEADNGNVGATAAAAGAA